MDIPPEKIRPCFVKTLRVIVLRSNSPLLARIIFKHMKTFISNIEEDTVANSSFRKVLFTTKLSQLVLMSLKPGEDIGEEVHEVDQFLRLEAGTGKAVLDGMEYNLTDGSAIVVPAGARHNIINTGSDDLKLYTIYTPPEHKDGTLHQTKTEALADIADHFDGKTSLE